MKTTRFSTVKHADKLKNEGNLNGLKNTLNTSSIWSDNIKITTETNGLVSYTYQDKVDSANSIVTMIANLETQENKMRTYQFTKTDGSAGNQVKDTEVNNKLGEIKKKVDGIKKLGRAVDMNKIDKFFKYNASPKDYNLNDYSDVIVIKNRINHCENIEKAYIKKHVELYILSKICKDLYTNMNKNMEYYAKLRVIHIDNKKCGNGSVDPQDPGYKPGKNIQIRLPPAINIDQIQQAQNDILTALPSNTSLQNVKDAHQKVPHQKGGSTTNEVIFRVEKYHEAFKNFDGLMNVVTAKKKQKLQQQGSVTKYANSGSSSITVTSKQDYKNNINLWHNVLLDYKNTIQKQFGINIGDNDTPDDIINNVNKYTSQGQVKPLPSTPPATEVPSNEMKQKYESYFLRCHSYEYLYIKKHEEFMKLYKFVLYLIIHYTYTYIILTLYINVLQKVTIECTGTGFGILKFPHSVDQNGKLLPVIVPEIHAIIQDPRKLVNNQQNMMHRINETMRTLKQNVNNATQKGGNPSQIGGSQSIKNLLDILLKLVNIIKDPRSASLGSSNPNNPNDGAPTGTSTGMKERDSNTVSADPRSLTVTARNLLSNITNMFGNADPTFKNVNQKEDKIKL
jgi:hypothetical protein